MTDIDTKELRRLMEEATPGPWSVWANYGAPMVSVSGNDDRTATSGMYRIDATLIVAMYSALPALLSEAEEAARLREGLSRLLTTAKLLYANAEGCAVNHYGEDFSIHGLPGWLADCQADIEHARALTTGGDDARD